ncbi:MAG: DUF87 domain-containing protein [Pseudomonadota bacterium]
MDPQVYEKLGLFYLGRQELGDEEGAAAAPLLYESRDLTTHAAIIGMTGSGKTGLGVGLIEEAAIDGIPVIAIDPKGDLGNLMLTFPDLDGDSFAPWINPRAAADRGLTSEEFATQQADLWRRGLKSWGQEPDRITRLREAADFAVYTPGSTAGISLDVLGDFAPPPAGTDDETGRERLTSTVSALLMLLGLDVDPLTSREHLLLSQILQTAWAEGKSPTLADLIHQVQRPPFEILGVMSLDAFYPEKDRFELAMRMNSLLASPGFSAWMQGEPLQAENLLYTEHGKPKVSVVYIAHLGDEERMFVVCRLLTQLIAWMRAQPGTTSLRAVLYMDEVFGYLPPVANPPAKTLFLTLLKQARAYGVGLVLATQNPIDLDYRALSNMGTWMIGRLQTERDKMRVRDGLESADGSDHLDTNELMQTLSSLGKRRFLLHNVHEDAPVIFETRWVMSYLPGPLTRDQIERVMAPIKAERSAGASTPRLAAAPATASPTTVAAPGANAVSAPVAPKGVEMRFAPRGASEATVEYVPYVLGIAEVSYHSVRYKIDTIVDHAWLARIDPDVPGGLSWEDAVPFGGDASLLAHDAPEQVSFADVDGGDARVLAKHQRAFKFWLRTQQPLTLYRCADPKAISELEETEARFVSRLVQVKREERDLAIAKSREKFATKLERLEEKVRKAKQAVEREAQQASGSSMGALATMGGTVLSMLVGRKRRRKLSTVSREMSNAAKQRGDVKRAKENVKAIKTEMRDLEKEAKAALADLEDQADEAIVEVEELPIRPKSADIAIHSCMILWAPRGFGAGGRAGRD